MIDLDKIDVSDFLPHRAPFLMIDRLIDLSENFVSTTFKVKEDCIFNENNFLNEIGLTENAAQTCSSIVGSSFFEDDDIKGEGTTLIGFISAIKKVEIFSCPSVGDTIISKANLKSRFDTDNYTICSLDCNTYLGTTKLLYCEINLIIQELKQFYEEK
jgi:predicted hotdog family 3-hydroxylacyl-ACP dehydratase